MPHPFVPRPGSIISGGAVIFRQRPALAVGPMVVAESWAVAETVFIEAVAAITAPDLRREPQSSNGFYHQPNDLVSTTLRAQDSVRGRNRQAGALFSGTGSQALVKLWRPLQEKIEARARERNRVAHAMWWWAREYPNDLIAGPEPYIRYQPGCFEAIAARIEALEFSIDVFGHEGMALAFEARRSAK